MEITLPQIASRVGGFSIDTRTLQAGDLYFALRGEVHDGHDFVSAAFDKGAAGAVVDQAIDSRRGPVIQVADTLAYLQQLAHDARVRWAGTIIGVTGSAGKTSTKDAVAHLLSSVMPVGKTIGNFNNHIGVPLSILRLPSAATIGVLEMGMNHAGEIRDLCRIAMPEIGVVTNVGHAHVEFFDGIEGIAAAKRELIEALPASGHGILNADDARVKQFKEVHPRSITYGFSADADVRAEIVDASHFRCSGITFETRLVGRHAISNIIAAIAVSSLFGIPAARLVEPVSTLTPGKMRGERIVLNGIIILNDAYNSNPAAASAMLDVLRDTPAQRRIAVLGEMLELGVGTGPLHRDLGHSVAESGIDVLIGIRGGARFMVDEARKAGMSSNTAYFFETPDEAGKFLCETAREGDAILFKGSRGVQVERALDVFTQALKDVS